jgi:hypothetical protein
LLTASELLKQGRDEELWQMCCGFLDLDIKQFMEIQERLLIDQLELLNNSRLGKKLFRGKKPQTLEEFRRLVQLTSYKDYLPELSEKQEDGLPGKPLMWARSSGRSGDFPCKWIPLTKEYLENLSANLYGVGVLASAQHRGDTSPLTPELKLLYSVAPRPYISGTFADALRLQSPFIYLPSLEKAEKMTYEDRISLGFQEALDKGLDYFFGLSLVLVKVGEKLKESSGKVKIGPYLKRPKALFRLTRGLIKSKLEHRPLMPKDIWNVKGIIGSGIDSWVYKDKIKELWGRNPLDLYSCTEGGVIATQTWDYEGMSFFPNVNFLEFIPEVEQTKLAMDHTYIPKTLLLNEVQAGEEYEIVITSFHGGSLVRYRIGDIIKIASLSDDKTGVKTPQMVFERRNDGIIDFASVRLTEKMVWKALEDGGVKYQDWVAYKVPGVQTLDLFIEPQTGYDVPAEELETIVCAKLMQENAIEDAGNSEKQIDLESMIGFNVKIHFLERGFFTEYSLQKQKEGADLAHIKPPHLNPRGDILSRLIGDSEETIVISKSKTKIKTEVSAEASAEPEKDEIPS